MTSRRPSTALCCVLAAMTLTACGQAKRPAEAPSAEAASSPADEGATHDAPAYPSPVMPAPTPPTATASPAASRSDVAKAESAQGESAGPRTTALREAARDFAASQRELDVAAGDCKNACRALGSMDRAAARVCALARGDGDAGRCEDVSNRLYSARDRVRTTCGSCPGGPSVERGAPIPSSP